MNTYADKTQENKSLSITNKIATLHRTIQTILEGVLSKELK